MPELLQYPAATSSNSIKYKSSPNNLTSTPSNTLPRCRKKREKLQFAEADITEENNCPQSAEQSSEQLQLQGQANRSFIRSVLRAKKVRFFRNGDQYFKGIWYAIHHDRFRSLDALLEDLTRSVGDLVNLPHGVRHLFTLDGSLKITCLDDLMDGESYVCCSNEFFKRIDYERARAPVWRIAAPRKPSLQQEARLSLASTPAPPVIENNDFVHPRIVTVIRNGVKPRKVVRLLLNKRTAPSYHQVLSDITAAVKLDSGAVKKVFNLDGKLISTLADFFQDDDVFIAYGTERLTCDDFYLDSEECKFLYSKFRTPKGTVSNSLTSSTARSPKVARKALNRPDLLGVSRPSPVLRRRFLHQRNQKKLRPRLSPLSPTSATSTPSVDATPTIANDQSAPSTSAAAANHEPSLNGQENEAKTSNGISSLPLEIEDRFKLGRVLGDGNFAVVHEAVCRESKRLLALKIIDKSKCQGKEELVENEVALLRRVSHPYIVQLYDVIDCSDNYFLSMELVKGGDLFDALVSVRQYSEKEALSMMNCLVSALEYLHRINIVHRDVKPENLLVYDDGSGSPLIKLADFGLASRADQTLFTVCGTPTYVAPEILSENGYGLKVDLWAAGVIFYIMLCGFPPFISMQNSQEELFNLILSGHFEFPSPYWDYISNAAKSLIQGMLQLDPMDRYSAEEVLLHPWMTGDAQATAEFEELSKLAAEKGKSPEFDPDFHSSKLSHSFFERSNVEFYYSRRRSMDDLSVPSQDLAGSSRDDSFVLLESLVQPDAARPSEPNS